MQKFTKQTLKIYWQHAQQYRWRAFLVMLGIIAMTGIDTVKPLLYKRFFDTAISLGLTNVTPLVNILLLLLVLSAVIRLIWSFTMFGISQFESRTMSDLLNTCYEYLLNHSYNFFSNNFIGSLVTKVRRFQRSFEVIADQLYLDLGRSILIITFIVGVLFWRYWVLGAAMLVWVLAFAALSVIFARYKIKYDLIRADLDSKTTAQLADTMMNNQNIKLFASFDSEFKAFRRITDILFEARKKAWNVGNALEIVQSLLTITLEVSMLYLGIKLWQRGIITIGDFALLQAYILRILDKSWGIGSNIKKIYESLADANEMTEMLIEPHEIVDQPRAKKLKVSTGAISFQDVNFSYHEESSIFSGFNLNVAAGERVALIGPSGGGKSTIVKLLFRFLDIQGGQITIDGQNIAHVTQDSLRRQISLVPQEPILFHRSLLDNIRYGRPGATEEQVIAAAKAAHCHEFIAAFSEGYSTFVGERGVKLSGGERQRVAIARAILKNAPILVLDEATSSLDSESEHYIQDALHTLMKGKTTIVIAHRLSTIMEMDRIVVIENGKITEQGKHEELLKAKQGTYQRLWHIQAGGFAEAAI
jgi:ATP-binding cassette, subfamily B, bacterial